MLQAGLDVDNFGCNSLSAGETPANQPDYSDLNESLHQAGYHHFCINVDSVDETLAELRKREVTIVGEPFNLEAIGRRLSLQTPRAILLNLHKFCNWSS